MLFTTDILLPGPTPVPDRVQKAMMAAATDHRGHVFTPVADRVRERLHALFHLDAGGAVAVIPTTGTGGLEAAVQNFFQPGDPVLSVVTGAFGERVSAIAKAMGLAVDELTVPWGEAFDPAAVMSQVNSRRYRGILVTHNETSTGVLNPVEELGQALSAITDKPLYIVDSISGVPSIPLDMAGWGIDVAVAASQKGFMCPPGLGLVAVGSRARQKLEPARPGLYFFALTPYLEGQFPYTPAVSLWYGLDEALTLLEEEGEAARFARHRTLGRMARQFGMAAGFPPKVRRPEWGSPTVTPLTIPAGNPAQIRRQLATYGLQIAGGMGAWHHEAVRIGHVGAVGPSDLFAGLSIFAHVVPHPAPALEAAWSVWHDALGDN